MRLVDAHCHLDLFPDFERVVEETSCEGVWTLAVTNAPSVYRKSSAIAAGRKSIRTAVGLHPELAHRRFAELPRLLDLIEITRFVGEVGLDYVTTDEDNRDSQRKVFESTLAKCASLGDRLISVHSRRAANDVVSMIGPDFPGAVILHWPSMGIGTMRRAVANGYYFSVNCAMLSGDAGRRLLREIPEDRLLTETDGPFTAANERPSEPKDVRPLLNDLASLQGRDVEELAESIWSNFCRVTKKPEPKQVKTGLI